MNSGLVRWAVAVVGAFALGTAVSAADPAVTKITVPDLDCPSCAKKVVAKLQALDGVAEVKADVDSKIVTVTAKPKAKLSALSLWEAVEKGGKEVSKIEGPDGTVTAKPKA
ncbi:MAG TPA: heavy-metal-associated domain-containing protein [Gemmataceae bacterium]|jgi:Cu+-exporting ATPase|nr:heavy-metal-associated domain-containing protein [Gemmataceae bacterium]